MISHYRCVKLKCRLFYFYEYYNNWTSSQRRQLFEMLYCCHVAGESSLLGHMRGPKISIFTFAFNFSLLLLLLSCLHLLLDAH